MKVIVQYEASTVPIHIGCGDGLRSFLWMLPDQSSIHDTKSRVYRYFCVETIDITGDKDCWPLAVALGQVIHENCTTVLRGVLRQTAHGEWPVSHPTQRVLAGGLDCAVSNTSGFCSSRLPRPMCAGGMNAPVCPHTALYRCKYISYACLRLGYRC
jgi:hypothetical protein